MSQVRYAVVRGLALWVVLVIQTAHAQDDWPHYSADWSDSLFQARVQGVYDWVRSGPDRLETGEQLLQPIPFYQIGTQNRDLETFPPRPVDVETRDYLEPKDWMDRRFLILYMQDNPVIEQDYFESNLEQNPLPDTYYLMGNILFQLGRYNEAITYYDRALEEFPFFKLAFKNKAFAAAILGDCDMALASANEAAALGAFSAHLKNVQAYCAFQSGDYAAAEEASGHSLLINPANIEVVLLRIRSLVALGRYGQAQSLAEEIEDRALSGEVSLDVQIEAARQSGRDGELFALLELKSRFRGLDQDESLLLAALREEAFAARGAGIELPVDDGETVTALEAALQENPLDCDLLIALAIGASQRQETFYQDSLLRRAVSGSRSCDNESLQSRALLRVRAGEYAEANRLMQRDWNQKIATGEIPDELTVRKYRAIARLSQMTGE